MKSVPSSTLKGKGEGVSNDEDEVIPAPIDVVLDSLIGTLESDSAYEREVANVVFDFICQDFEASSIELLLTVCPNGHGERSDQLTCIAVLASCET